MELKITQIGNSLGVILPKDLLAKLKVSKGDALHLLETKDGVELTPYDPEFADRMERVERIMRDNRNLLKRLAE
ncbi:MAG: AbrB/MazE/SpoVT family DNA-binding domain-containing protein [Thermoleophilia bacterium]|nr:AbrB/MazE/SpoVT family DNA-binding domain-containing protein [Thermoleophilia bacterium]